MSCGSVLSFGHLGTPYTYNAQYGGPSGDLGVAESRDAILARNGVGDKHVYVYAEGFH